VSELFRAAQNHHLHGHCDRPALSPRNVIVQTAVLAHEEREQHLLIHLIHADPLVVPVPSATNLQCHAPMNQFQALNKKSSTMHCVLGLKFSWKVSVEIAGALPAASLLHRRSSWLSRQAHDGRLLG
jgi:hypothetical protein